MSLQPGDTLDRSKYRIIRLLGRGGFGFVYLAEDTLLHEEVAIKELIPALVGDETMLKRFLAEARATMRLRHERLVGTHNVFAEGGNYYIVMEYMPGGSLEARLQQQGSLPVDEAVHVAADVAEGLAYAREHGVVHCDLKPANILFTAEGHAKVGDFGIAHVSGEMLTRTWLTPAGFVAGTLPYMSPEQADGVRDDPRVDVYALGAVLYRMLTGRPYLDFEQHETPAAQARNMRRIEQEAPQPPSRCNPRVPAWLDGVVLKALAKQPAERWGSSDRMRAALLTEGRGMWETPKSGETILAVSGPGSPVASVRARPHTVAQRPSARAARRVPLPWPRWLWPVVGGAAVLITVAIASLVLTSRDHPPPTPTATSISAQALAMLDTALPTDRRTAPLSPDVRQSQAATVTLAPTETPVPPTATPVPPTSARTPPADMSSPPTSTPKPPTNTPFPPTRTRLRPTRTSVPPTPTPLPSSTPPPTATTRPTAKPECAAVSGPFATVWSAVQSQIGCAAGDAIQGLTAEEGFVGGRMFWREPIDYAQVLVLFNNRSWRIFKHSPFVEGSPDFSCPDADTPSQCPPTPKRGFGMTWCDIPEIRRGLGNAVDCERGYQGLMQSFEHGFMIRNDLGLTYVFYDTGQWETR